MKRKTLKQMLHHQSISGESPFRFNREARNVLPQLPLSNRNSKVTYK